MLTALLLAEAGLPVTIIDREWRTAAHSYACVLHPGALRLLNRLGMADDVLNQGRRIERAAFYEGGARRGEFSLSQLPGPFPCALALPQNLFEDLLEQRLRQRHGIEVLWNHRLTDIEMGQQGVIISMDRLKQTGKGYIVAEWDWAVQKQLQVAAAFVIGADGHDSTVRKRLGIEWDARGEPEVFAVFEFQTETDPGTEVRIVVHEDTTSVLWPLPGRCARWSFQLHRTKQAERFPDKEREALRMTHEEVDQTTRDYVLKLAARRAPWFTTGVKEVYWWARIRFEHRLARSFGRQRCWLAGDAAHQTGPVGVQSMNAGLLEAEDVTARLKAVIHSHASPGLLEAYGQVNRSQWEKLLAADGGNRPRTAANPWLEDHWDQIRTCLPATGEDLARLVCQQGFDF